MLTSMLDIPKQVSKTVEKSDAISCSYVRDLAFCGGGTLSSASRNKVNAWRDRLNAAACDSIAANFTLSVYNSTLVEAAEAQRIYLMLSNIVEQEDNAALLLAHPNMLSLGEIDRLARMCIRKFNKRLAASIRIPIKMGDRVFTIEK